MFTILYVDDEPGLLEVGKLFLEQGGQFSVETITSAQRALELLASRHYDAIISDYQMPGMDGIEFLKKVRKTGNTIPFIIFTGRGREEIVIQALNEGADFYLQKGGEPLSQFAELAHKVRQAVQQRRAEASIRDHERREADIINFLPDATFAIDARGRVIAWNRAMERMTGVRSPEILGRGNHEYAIPFYHERRPMLIDLVLLDDPEIVAQYPYIKKEGKHLYSEITIPHFNGGRGAALWFTASPLYDTAGKIAGAIESIREITERKRMEEALSASEQRYRNIVEDQTEFICRFRPDGTHVFVNEAYCRYFGLRRDEIIGHRFLPAIPPQDRDAVRRFFASLTPDHPVDIIEHRIVMPDGRVQWQRWSDRAIFDTAGAVIEYQSVGRDTTERKVAEENLRHAKDYVENLIRTANAMVVELDLSGRVVRFNQVAEEITGYTEAELAGHSWFEKIAPKDRYPRVWEEFNRLITGGLPTHFENPILTQSGGERYIVWKNSEILGDNGQITGTVSFGIDITEQKQAEDAVRQSEQKYRTVFETTGTATVLIENDGTISLVNSEFERLSGYSRDAVENRKHWMEFVVPQDLDRMVAQHRLRRQDRSKALTHYEFRFQGKSGEVRDIYLHIDLIPGTSQSVASLLDITERKRAEQDLITANQEYASLLDQLQDVYYRSDNEGRLVRASRSWASLLGYDTIAECLGRNIAGDFYCDPADRKTLLEEVHRNGQVTNYEIRLKKKDGSPVIVATSTHLCRDPAGAVTGVEGTFRDITHRKRQENIFRAQLELGLRLQTLRGGEEILAACLDAAIAVAGLDAGGIYLVDERTGSVDLVLSRNLGIEFVSSVSHYTAGSANARIVLEGKPIYEQFNTGVPHTPVQEREGLRAIAIIPVLFRERVIACLNLASHMRDDIPKDARIAVETIALQIGAAIERSRADEALVASEERYRNVIEDQTEFISRFLPDGTHVFVNDAYCRYFGLEREKILGHRFRPEFPPEDRLRMDRFFRTLTPENPVDVIEHRIIMPDGSVRWQRWSDRAIFDPSGRLIEYQSVGQDITERKETETALQESEERYRTLLGSVNEGIWVIDAAGTTTYVNQKMADMLGYTIAEMIGSSMFQFMDEKGREIARFNYPAYRNGVQEQVEFAFLRKDGTLMTGLVSNSSLFDPSGKFIGAMAAITDITRRKREEDQLRDSWERFQKIFEGSPLGIAIVSPDFRFRMINRQFCSMLQYREDELLGKSFTDITHPEHLNEDVAESRKVFTGESERYQTEKRYIRKDGSVLWASLTASPVKDKDGRVLYTIAMAEDVTDRKRAEQVIREANRKIALLTSITRHDIANRVTALRAYTAMALKKKPDPGITGLLAKIDTAASDIARQIEFTRAYQELSLHHPDWQRIGAVAAAQKTEGITLSITCDAEIYADPMLGRVFHNLIDNAVRHGVHATAITVGCRREPDDSLVIMVEDNGCGVLSDEKEMIFEKGYGKHTGFGLFLVREILAITGISITENGEPGHGARFELRVPKGSHRMASDAGNLTR